MNMNAKIPHYSSVHNKIRYKYGSSPCCVFCDTPSVRYEWANVTGDYTDSLEDYLPMCATCHRLFDVTDETRVKHSVAMKGRVNSRQCPVRQLQHSQVVGVFHSMSEAARQTGIGVTSIANNLSGRTKTAGGFTWEYQNAG